jgi:steroid delta-isomerase-like uncharacterized protein
MTADQSASFISRLFAEAFNQGDLAVVDDLLAPDYITHTTFGGAPHGSGGLKELIAMLRTAFPDLHCTVEDEISEDDRFAAHWMMGGKHEGVFLGSSPTGRRVEVQGIIFGRIANGRVVEDWTLIDQMSMLRQLRIIPPVKGNP